MSQYINIYTGDPTEGQADGLAVSEEGEQVRPIEAVVDANTQEEQTLKLALRCNPGWGAPDGATLTLDGDTKDCWSLGQTLDGTFSDTLKIDTPIINENVVFYAKVKAKDELPKRDTSVVVIVEADIIAD